MLLTTILRASITSEAAALVATMPQPLVVTTEEILVAAEHLVASDSPFKLVEYSGDATYEVYDEGVIFKNATSQTNATFIQN
jgi:hypothetical protein